MVYLALHRLERAGLLESTWGGGGRTSSALLLADDQQSPRGRRYDGATGGPSPRPSRRCSGPGDVMAEPGMIAAYLARLRRPTWPRGRGRHRRGREPPVSAVEAGIARGLGREEAEARPSGATGTPPGRAVVRRGGQAGRRGVHDPHRAAGAA